MKNLKDLCLEINTQIQSITISENYFHFEGGKPQGFEAYRQVIQANLLGQSECTRQRIEAEYFGYGPLIPLLNDESITEVIINCFDCLWIEKNGQLMSSPDTFYSDHTYEHFLKRLYLEIGQEPSLTVPFVDSSWHGHRLHIIAPYTFDHPATRLTIRKHQKIPWSLEQLKYHEWAGSAAIEYLKQIIGERKNFVVIGPTGSGKTSVLNALLQECYSSDRMVILEDSQELTVPNPASTLLLTRFDSRNILPSITLSDLVRQSLRMRPDRLVIGEVRGGEAKDLLMALATGHSGSASTLHASDARQALIRLEMLIQMGAPDWSLQAIRRLIQMSLDYIIVCARQPNGRRYLDGIYKLISLEDSGLIIERIHV